MRQVLIVLMLFSGVSSLAEISPVWATRGDCVAMVDRNPGLCRGDCRAVLQNMLSHCQSSDCRAFVTGSLGYCAYDAFDCRAYLLNNYATCESENCRAILLRNRGLCR